MLQEKLLSIGLSKAEARIYLEMLKIGGQPVSVIARKAGANRSSAYAILKVLSQKGLVASYVKNNLALFKANDPNALVAYLDRKNRSLDYQREQILMAIPKFRELLSSYNYEVPRTRLLDKLDGVNAALNEVLSFRKNLFIYFPALNGYVDFFCDFFEKMFQRQSEVLNPVELRILVPMNLDKKLNKVLGGLKSMLNAKIISVKNLEFNDLFGNQCTLIYDNCVTICSLIPNKEYAVIVESNELSKLQKGIFKILWGINGK